PVALLAVALFATNRGPAWTVLSTTGDGIAIVDETPVPLAHAEELERRLRPGARVVAPEGAQVGLARAAGIVFQGTGGTEFTVPASPGRWFARRVTGAVRHGEIRVTTGPSFRGARLHLDTPEASVEVTGTTLAVICEPAGTCVCVFEGVVHVGAKGAAAEAVPGGDGPSPAPGARFVLLAVAEARARSRARTRRPSPAPGVRFVSLAVAEARARSRARTRRPSPAPGARFVLVAAALARAGS